jgi:hypothetical protein
LDGLVHGRGHRGKPPHLSRHRPHGDRAYGAITFTFKHKIISQVAALGIAAHIADKGDKSEIYNASDFK